MTEDGLRDEVARLIAQQQDRLLGGGTTTVGPEIHICYTADDGAPGWEIVALLLNDFNVKAERFHALHALGTRCARRRPVGVFLICEAWVSLSDDQGRPRYADLANDPQRAEAIVVTGSCGAACVVSRFLVERDAQGFMWPTAAPPLVGSASSALLDTFWRGAGRALCATN